MGSPKFKFSLQQTNQKLPWTSKGYKRINYGIFCAGDVILRVFINSDFPDVTEIIFSATSWVRVPPNFRQCQVLRHKRLVYGGRRANGRGRLEASKTAGVAGTAATANPHLMPKYNEKFNN